MPDIVIESVDHTDKTTYITTAAGVTEYPRLNIAPRPGDTVRFTERGFSAFGAIELPGVTYVTQIVHEPGSTAAYLMLGWAPLACLGECTNAAGFNAWGNGKKQDLDLLTSYVKGDAS